MEKKFTLWGKELVYDANRVEYNRIRYRFQVLAENNRRKIYEEYDAFGDLDNFYEKYVDWVKPYFLAACDIALDELGKLKYYGIDQETYFEEVFDCSAVVQAVEPIEKYYEELAEKKEQRHASHARRLHAGTHLRENYYDGGETALSLSANMVGGVAAGSINVLATGFNFLSDLSDKSDIYEKSRDTVPVALLYSLESAYWELIQYAIEKCPKYPVENIPVKDLKEADGICKNLLNGKIPAKEVFNMTGKILMLNPYAEEAYQYLMLNYGDAKLELQKLADFFHIAGLDALQTKMLHNYYKTLKPTTEESAIACRDKMNDKANYLGMSKYLKFQPLENLITDFDLQYRTVAGIIYPDRDSADRQKELYKLYQSLDWQSNKKKALESQDMLHKKAEELKISANWLTPYMECNLQKIQKKAWETLDKFYQTLQLKTEEKAVAAREILAKKAKELEIDDYKNYPPLEGLIKQFDELAKTCFDYRFKSREEAQSAKTNETVFFKTVWTAIATAIDKTSLMQYWDKISEGKQQTIAQILHLKDTPFAFADTTLLSSGKSGIAFTPTGIFWCNGSALLTGVANNVVFKTLFKKKSEDLLKKNTIVNYSVSWKEFFEGNTVFSVDEKKMIPIVSDKLFEASHAKSQEICDLLKKIHDWKEEVKFTFTEQAFPIPDKADLIAAPELTPIPDTVKISVSTPEEPFPDNLVLLQCANQFRESDSKLMIAPKIPQKIYDNFLGELDENLRKSAAKESAIAQADHTKIFGSGEKGFLLTNKALYTNDGTEARMIILSDIIDVANSDDSIEIYCADQTQFEIKGKGVRELAKILQTALSLSSKNN